MSQGSEASAGGFSGSVNETSVAVEDSTLNERAFFLKQWSWPSVVALNKGICLRANVLHGFNSDAKGQSEELWHGKQQSESTLREAYVTLLEFHRRSPFLFFNGNTFAEIGKKINSLVYADLPAPRRKQIDSTVGHFVTGVLDENSMVQAVDESCRVENMKAGDHVSTLGGSLTGTIESLDEAGNILWRPLGAQSVLKASPFSLKLTHEPPQQNTSANAPGSSASESRVYGAKPVVLPSATATMPSPRPVQRPPVYRSPDASQRQIGGQGI